MNDTPLDEPFPIPRKLTRRQAGKWICGYGPDSVPTLEELEDLQARCWGPSLETALAGAGTYVYSGPGVGDPETATKREAMAAARRQVAELEYQRIEDQAKAEARKMRRDAAELRAAAAAKAEAEDARNIAAIRAFEAALALQQERAAHERAWRATQHEKWVEQARQRQAAYEAWEAALTPEERDALIEDRLSQPSEVPRQFTFAGEVSAMIARRRAERRSRSE